ncbi:MAG: hypothetical protein IT291_04135 [Deltaproteobacteria bacterium]|nr:hypothetical protein [Deltaproteobacteria bacterium]
MKIVCLQVFRSSLFSNNRNFFSSTVIKLLVISLAIFSLGACFSLKASLNADSCKIRAYVDKDFVSYVRSRFHSEQPVRLAIMPFDVPESFAAQPGKPRHFGKDLAEAFQAEFLRQEKISIVEFFNIATWPGKREEFLEGNYASMELARGAGYDFLLVGQLAELRSDDELKLLTKVIDLSNNVTLWYGDTTVHSGKRDSNRELSKIFLERDRPDVFSFEEQVYSLAECTLRRLLYRFQK